MQYLLDGINLPEKLRELIDNVLSLGDSESKYLRQTYKKRALKNIEGILNSVIMKEERTNNWPSSCNECINKDTFCGIEECPHW